MYNINKKKKDAWKKIGLLPLNPSNSLKKATYDELFQVENKNALIKQGNLLLKQES